MTRVRWTEQAARDLEDIKSFIGKDSQAYALAVVGRLYEAAMQLGRFPDSGRIVPERGNPTIREVVWPPYRIDYRRSPELVEILFISGLRFHFQISTISEALPNDAVKLTNSAIALELLCVQRSLRSLVWHYWSALFAAYL